MSSASLLRKPQGSACVVAHASSLRSFSLFSSLTTVLPATYGLVDFSPPDQISPYLDMDSLITDQGVELCGLIPPDTHVVLLGDCMAGHMTLNLARRLRSSGLTVRKVVLLDTVPLEALLEARVIDLLTFAGEAEDFGILGSRLLELDEQRKASKISLELWAAQIFDAMREHRNLLAKWFQQSHNVSASEADEIAEFRIDWARFAGIILTSTAISYAGAVTLLASPEMTELPLLKLWKPTLPEIKIVEDKIRHADIATSPMIPDILIRK